MGLLTDRPAVTFVLTRDRQRLKPFYQDILGLRQLSEDPFGTVYDLNGATLRLTTVEAHVASLHTVLGWEVADIVATAKDLREKGVSINIYPGFGQDDLGIWSSPDGRTRVLWFNDPEGNGLSLTQG